MQIHNVTFEVGRRGDGSAVIVLDHGGLRLEVDLSDCDRRELGRMLLEPLYACVPFEIVDVELIEEIGG